jgi:hypothetical protein
MPASMALLPLTSVLEVQYHERQVIYIHISSPSLKLITHIHCQDTLGVMRRPAYEFLLFELD